MKLNSDQLTLALVHTWLCAAAADDEMMFWGRIITNPWIDN